MSVKRTRNRLFTMGALVTAIGAIGAGAVVSSGAMAATDDAAEETVSISMIQIGEDGMGFECTLDGDDLGSDFFAVEAVPVELMPEGTEIPAAFEVELDANGGWVAAEGIEGLEALEGVEGVEIGVAIAAPTGDIVEGEPIEGQILEGQILEGELLESVTAAEMTDVRDGTEEECAALVEQMSSPELVTGDGVIGVTGSVEIGS